MQQNIENNNNLKKINTKNNITLDYKLFDVCH